MLDSSILWAQLATQLRIDSIRCTTAAGSGHPTSALSAADLMAVLQGKYFHFDWSNPVYVDNDRLIFSKGHACPLLYSMFKASGAISDAELLTLRKFGSRLQGHPNPRVLPYVDVATGSLGQGLPMGVGMALNGKYLEKLPYRVWVLLGDSEMAEGSVWEGFDKAWHYKLDNLVAIIDVNRLGQRGPTELEWNTAAYAARARAFGWHAIELDGHDLLAIDAAYTEALAQTEQPTCLIARTEKGHGVSFLANKEGWHGKALNEEQAKEALAELGPSIEMTVPEIPPIWAEWNKRPVGKPLELPVYAKGSKEATRKAYGDALRAIGASDLDVVALDAEVSNSTHADEFAKAYPDRFFEMFIAEQQMVSAAVGLAAVGKKPFASTFACFLTRAYDQIRIAAISNVTIHLCGSHVGVSIGEDGPSQMGLEDIAMMRAVCGSTVLYPSDANQTAKLVRAMLDVRGISYLRTTRGKTPVIYDADESFPVGGSKVHGISGANRATIVAAGITLHESLAAQKELRKRGIDVRVIDLYSVKPIDAETLQRAAAETGRLVVVEDHWREGGLGDAVSEVFTGLDSQRPAIVKLAVSEMPGSGTPEELLAAAGIDAGHIVTAVEQIVGSETARGGRLETTGVH
jgi:transketolase